MKALIKFIDVECIIEIHKETSKAYYVTQSKGTWVNPVQFWMAKSNIQIIEIEKGLIIKHKGKTKYIEHQRIRTLHKRMNLKTEVCSCGSTKDLHLHHITYDEEPNVITLCKQCHAKEHL